jgi:hypothetical protein
MFRSRRYPRGLSGGGAKILREGEMEMRENEPKQERKVTRRFDSGVDHEDLDPSNNNPGIGFEDDGGRIRMSLLLSLSLLRLLIDDWPCLCRLHVQPSEPNLLDGRHRFPRVAGL